jgi:hypothetical protein
MGVGNPDHSSGDGPAIILVAMVVGLILLAGSCKAADHYWPGWDEPGAPTHNATKPALCPDAR